MVKRCLIPLIVCVLVAFPFSLSASAVDEYILNYPIYDTNTLTSSRPTVLAPYGIRINKNTKFSFRNGKIGMTSSTFNSNISSGNITVLDDSNPVNSYPDDGVFVTPSLVENGNTGNVLAPLGVAITNTSQIYGLYASPSGQWSIDLSDFETYSGMHFIVIPEPETEAPDDPTPPSDEQKDRTPIVRYSIFMGFSLYCIVSLIGYGIYKSVHLIKL